MINKIEHGYVHLKVGRGCGIYEIQDFDNDELRENRSILQGKLLDAPMTQSQTENVEDCIRKINEELEKRINNDAIRR